MSDPICDVINYCPSSFAMGKTSVYDQIVTKTLKSKTDMADINKVQIRRRCPNCLHKFLSKRWFTNGIYSL